jgi:serine/threonine protein phosphatase PrpC
MKIDLVYEKGIKSTNEDSYLIGVDIWGVFDGANSMNKFIDFDGRTGGQIASSIAKESFGKNSRHLRETAIEANLTINAEMVRRGIDTSDKLNLWCTNLAAIKMANNRLEWIRLGDATIVFIYTDNSFKVISDDESHDKETLIKWSESAKNKIENIRKVLDEQIKSVRRKINVTYGFLTGEKEMEKFIREGVEERRDVKRVILFTDGFSIPQKNPLEPYPWNKFVDKYLEEDIEGLKIYIRDLEKSDPNCWTYPRQKVHDDMTAISITF